MNILGFDVQDVVAGAIGGAFLVLSGWGGAKAVRSWFAPKNARPG